MREQECAEMLTADCRSGSPSENEKIFPLTFIPHINLTFLIMIITFLLVLSDRSSLAPYSVKGAKRAFVIIICNLELELALG